MEQKDYQIQNISKNIYKNIEKYYSFISSKISEVNSYIPENIKDLLLEIAEISIYITLFLIFSRDNKKTPGVNYKNYIMFSLLGGTASFLLREDKEVSRVIKTSILGTAATQAMLNNL